MPTIEGPQETWDWLAEKVVARRNELGLTQAEVVAQSGGLLSQSVLSLIENARSTSYRDRSLTGLTRALQWGPDGWHYLMMREDPIEGRARDQARVDAAISRVPEPVPAEMILDLLERVENLENNVHRIFDRLLQEFGPVPPPEHDPAQPWYRMKNTEGTAHSLMVAAQEAPEGYEGVKAEDRTEDD